MQITNEQMLFLETRTRPGDCHQGHLTKPGTKPIEPLLLPDDADPSLLADDPSSGVSGARVSCEEVDELSDDEDPEGVG